MPPMVLLPLVDYAFASVAHEGTLRIAARASDGFLRLRVETSGGSRDASAQAEAKLAALRERLSTLYGDAARLMIGSRDGANIVTLEIPHAENNGDHR